LTIFGIRKRKQMRTPAIIFSLFIVAAAAIIALNKKNPAPIKPIVVKEFAPADPGIPLTSVEFSDAVQNLGNVKNGETLNIEYHFKNTGNEMLVIKDVSASCGCTIPEKPQEPIAPGKSGVIKATFDSRNREGLNHKVLTVYANTKEAKHELTFDVEVSPNL